MPKLFDWGKKDGPDPFGFKASGILDDAIKNHKEIVTQNVNLDEKQQKKLAEKHCVACIFNELKRAGFTHDYGNTACFSAAKSAIKKLGYTAHPDRLCQFAMDYLLKERDKNAETDSWFEEIHF